MVFFAGNQVESYAESSLHAYVRDVLGIPVTKLALLDLHAEVVDCVGHVMGLLSHLTCLLLLTILLE